MGITTGIFTIFFTCSSQLYDTSNWVEVVGKLTKQSHGKSSATEFEYTYNGETYNRVSSGRDVVKGNKTVLGELYVLKVNPNKPEQYIILPWKMVFNESEVIDSCIGKIIKVGEANPFGVKFRKMEFEYVAYGKLYTRYQYISLEDIVFFPKLRKNQCYPVTFWQEDPQRAILYFDRPVVNCETKDL